MRSNNLATVFLLAALTAPVAVGAPAHIEAAVASTERLESDRERDARDKPAALMEWAGIVPGMQVADVFGGGGYWTELLARAVGPEGRVRLVNNGAYQNFAREELPKRLAKGRLPNVRLEVVETCRLNLGRETFDLIVIVMSYHDLYFADPRVWPEIDAPGFLRQLHAALKPGGRLLILDHAAAAGSGKSTAGTIHRIEESWAKQDIESHGFRLDRSWDGLRNPDDDLSKLVFDPAVAGKTDRFVHLYRKG